MCFSHKSPVKRKVRPWLSLLINRNMISVFGEKNCYFILFIRGSHEHCWRWQCDGWRWERSWSLISTVKKVSTRMDMMKSGAEWEGQQGTHLKFDTSEMIFLRTQSNEWLKGREWETSTDRGRRLCTSEEADSSVCAYSSKRSFPTFLKAMPSSHWS